MDYLEMKCRWKGACQQQEWAKYLRQWNFPDHCGCHRGQAGIRITGNKEIHYARLHSDSPAKTHAKSMAMDTIEVDRIDDRQIDR